ncbi:hypothetical protein [Glycomyces xiaoerkulensis]|uniref:hypothetical protein n=1 Tax=Glycomyces xiaoerkulensis TaxID=2038139 RepID=UPI000C25AC9B|nr:hypothetical protein [Glycomyces xiaoerkulensis]
MSPAFDLRRDGERMLHRQWLRPGEHLVAQVPLWGLPHLDGVPRPPRTRSQRWSLLRRILLGWPKYLVLGVLAAVMADGFTPGGGTAKGPPVMIKGGPGTEAASLVSPALRDRGIWVLTDRRLAFVTVRGRTYSRVFSTDPEPGEPDRPHRPVPIETPASAPADRFRHEGKRAETKGGKAAGVYDRVVFGDGSTVALRSRIQPGS